jgi:hypothetical protein
VGKNQALEFCTYFPSIVPLGHEHLSELVHEIIQVHGLVRLHPIVKAFYKVVGYIIYLANGLKMTP